MGVNCSIGYVSSFDTYLIRQYLGKPLMLTKGDIFYDCKYKEERIRFKLNNFFRLSLFWEKCLRERVGDEIYNYYWKICDLVIFQNKPLFMMVKRISYNDRRDRNVFRAIL